MKRDDGLPGGDARALDVAIGGRDETVGRVDRALIGLVALHEGIARLELVDEQAAVDPTGFVAGRHEGEPPNRADAQSIGAGGGVQVAGIDDVGMLHLEERVATAGGGQRQSGERGDASPHAI